MSEEKEIKPVGFNIKYESKLLIGPNGEVSFEGRFLNVQNLLLQDIWYLSMIQMYLNSSLQHIKAMTDEATKREDLDILNQLEDVVRRFSSLQQFTVEMKEDLQGMISSVYKTAMASNEEALKTKIITDIKGITPNNLKIVR